MKVRRIELLILDGQGVVFTDPFQQFLDELADATNQAREIVRARWVNEVRDRAWRGDIADDEIWQLLSASSGDDWDARFEASFGPGPATARLPEWARIAPIWLLSNHRTLWIDRRLERLGLRDAFSRLLVSEALGALKPEPAVFAPILAHVQDPATVLLVDDQEKNVAAAAAHGMCSLLADVDGRWVMAVDQRLRA